VYLTKEELMGLKKIIREDLDEKETTGSGRYKKKRGDYVPVIQGNERIMLLYALDIINKLLSMLNKGDYSKDRILYALVHNDWKAHSLENKALSTERLLRDRLGIKPSKKHGLTYLKIVQAYYLQSAANYVADMLTD
jgi:hypothetical protein